EEKAAAHGVFADDVDGVVGQAAHDLRPRPAAVVRAVDVRAQVVEAEAVDGGVGRLRVEVAGVDDGDLAPGSQRGRRDVSPRAPAVARDVDEAVVRAGPDGIYVLV